MSDWLRRLPVRLPLPAALGYSPPVGSESPVGQRAGPTSRPKAVSERYRVLPQAGTAVTPTTTIALALFGFSSLATLLLEYLYRQKRLSYLLWWSWGWGLVALHYGSLAVMRWWPLGGGHGVVATAMLGVAVVLFFASAHAYGQGRVSVWLTATLAAAQLSWAVAHGLGWVSVPAELGSGLVLLLAARTFWEEGLRQESVTERLLAVALGAWGVLLLVVAVRPQWTSAPTMLGPLPLLPPVFAGLLMLVSLYEEENRRVERNMLSLASLNLAALGFTGEEMERALRQALQRIQRVMRLPAGALLVHTGDPDGLPVVVANGLSENFQQQARQAWSGLVHLVARLGGVMILREITSEGHWQSLEFGPAFAQVRELLRPEGLRNAVGVSLLARERVFGLLLLATPKKRRFSAPELRLLLALAHQVAMAVENSYLIQQISRRSDDLNILNEVSSALSSTLDLKDLFDRLEEEIRRLFGAEDFFIARYDPGAQQVVYDLLVVGGRRQPPRTHPWGNGLVEYILRTGQPLLIREAFRREVHRRGIVVAESFGSFCGVPIILYDRPAGVMALCSADEHAFDEERMELLRILANSAGIALENARLFGQEQERARQLLLLNNVSRHATSLLHLEQMLAAIVQELERGLPYDHVGIALANYQQQELEVRAEAGRRRLPHGRSFRFGEGLLGEVARTGEAKIVQDAAAERVPMVLPDSVSGVALPLIYAEELLGVFYVETASPHRFADSELLLLRTLSDQIATALYHARTLQKAQEQAITDGLTGVKTHRFLMEALSVEWRRTTRTGRSFSVLVLDLDRFKAVNDRFGHLEGDVVLRRVGRLLEEHCRRSDVVARYGGDEFVILMPETSLEQARQLANKLRVLIAGDRLLRQHGITVSCGIAVFPAHGSTPEEILERADAAMYLSKRRGGNAVSSAQRLVVGGPAERLAADQALPRLEIQGDFSAGERTYQQVLDWIERCSAVLNKQGRLVQAGELPAPILEGLLAVVRAVDEKQPKTFGHPRRVAEWVVTAAEALGQDPEEIEEMRLAGLLHDIGKIGVPEEFLRRSGELMVEEREVVRQHTVLGWQLVGRLPGMVRIQQMIRHHHEHFDGTGYPDRLAGHRIPLGARLIAIAETFDALTVPVRGEPRSVEQAIAELHRVAGRQLDPLLVQVFAQAVRRQESRTTDPGLFRRM